MHSLSSQLLQEHRLVLGGAARWDSGGGWPRPAAQGGRDERPVRVSPLRIAAMSQRPRLGRSAMRLRLLGDRGLPGACIAPAAPAHTPGHPRAPPAPLPAPRGAGGPLSRAGTPGAPSPPPARGSPASSRAQRASASSTAGWLPMTAALRWRLWGVSEAFPAFAAVPALPAEPPRCVWSRRAPGRCFIAPARRVTRSAPGERRARVGRAPTPRSSPGRAGLLGFLCRRGWGAPGRKCRGGGKVSGLGMRRGGSVCGACPRGPERGRAAGEGSEQREVCRPPAPPPAPGML